MSAKHDLTARQRKLLWRCRRGTKELDVMLSRFIAQYSYDLSENDWVLLEQLLEVQDPILNEWLYLGEPVTQSSLQPIVDKIRAVINR